METVLRDLEPRLVGRQVMGVTRAQGRAHGRYRRLNEALQQTIIALRRRGKYLLVALGRTELVIHLGMSGRLFVADSLPEVKHRRVVLRLSGGLFLVFVDRRRFGTLQLVEAADYSAFPTLARMGPEPLTSEFALDVWTKTTSDAKSPIKSILLGQRAVAGLGNIYADEVLYRARIHPATHGLNRGEALRLHRAIRQVLAEAIAHRGTTFSLYQDGLMKEGDYYEKLRAFDQTGKPCRRCRTPIVKIRLGGRGTHLCPKCQPEPSPTTR